MEVEVRRCLRSSSLDVMTFLNEVVHRFPNAISFAPGRPRDEFFDVDGALDRMDTWVRYRAAATGRSPDAVLTSLGQYGNTAGLIQDLLARHLAVDQGIHVDPDAIVVTTGCQEAMLIAALTLLDPATDTLLVSDPAYIGITGVAQLVGVPVHPVPSGDDGLAPEAVEDAIRAVVRSGRRPRALYDVPDFNNPLGTCMPLEARRELLRVVDRHGVLVFEDNPYGAFAYDHAPLPSLKALDATGSVIYMSSFAKTLFPGLRIGYLVADQKIAHTGASLAAALTTVKSLTTVNTPPIMQAIAGAALLEHDGSIAVRMQQRLPHYRAARDQMLDALVRHLGKNDSCSVRWNCPGGGFFVVLTLPFPFGTEQLERCARDYGVIVCPMSFFSLTPGREHDVRLSFSYVDGPTIEEGICRLSRFVHDEAARRYVTASRDAVTPQLAAEVTWSPSALSELVRRALARRGLPLDDAAFVAEALVETSVRGVDTHGVRLLPTYLAELEGGRARAKPNVDWESAASAVRVLDAGGALGPVAGRLAVDEAVSLARRFGVGVVSVRNSNHFGAAAVYSMLMARAGFVGIVCSNSDALVAPFGGVRPSLGTNPLSMAVVGNDGDVFCADFATSQIAYSRVLAHRAQGVPVPDEWVVTPPSREDGTRPLAADALKPIGGHKGQSLGMIVEILCSVLSGSPAGHELTHFYTEPFTDPRGVSHFVLAIDPAAFGDAAACRTRLSALLSRIRGEPALPGMRVVVPGDPEAEVAAARRRHGIPLAEPELSCIRRLVDEESACPIGRVPPSTTPARAVGAPRAGGDAGGAPSMGVRP